MSIEYIIPLHSSIISNIMFVLITEQISHFIMYIVFIIMFMFDLRNKIRDVIVVSWQS